jgi:heterodisulfide reductase subunit A
VGSRNTNQCKNGYCSSVCCMYAIKEALVTAEHTSGGGLEQAIFFMDIRSHGKDFDRFYEGAKDKGVRFVRARPHSIEAGAGNHGVSMRYSTDEGEVKVEEFDLAVLSVGLEPAGDAQELARVFKFDLDEYGFARTSDFAPVTTNRAGVFVAGAFQAPKAIPRSVAEASTAACEAAATLIDARGELTRTRSYPAERSLGAEPVRIGVFVCSCGINIAGIVNVDEVVKYARTLPGVVLAENNLFSCSADTQELMGKKISEHRLNRVVIAACTPRTHEPLFQDTLRESSLNPYLVEMANIRNQNSWVHQREPERATAKAKDQVRMAVAKAALSTPIASGRVNVIPPRWAWRSRASRPPSWSSPPSSAATPGGSTRPTRARPCGRTWNPSSRPWSGTRASRCSRRPSWPRPPARWAASSAGSRSTAKSARSPTGRPCSPSAARSLSRPSTSTGRTPGS